MALYPGEPAPQLSKSHGENKTLLSSPVHCYRYYLLLSFEILIHIYDSDY